jgi:2-polyprenyl-6-hydroxyphenyl methylase/3-demethylubiquinone-9 3-methyltransferase
MYLKEQYFKDDPQWVVEKGSALDDAYLKALGHFDIVYSWGVLHHTGDMWRALDLASGRVKKNGHLFISIYNDQGRASRWWKQIKKIYNGSGQFIRGILIIYTLLRHWGLTFLRDILKTGNFLHTWKNYHENRGMSAWHDVVDWVGGYPFEVAKPEEIFQFFKERGFKLTALKTCAGGVGCNEYVFIKER